MPRYEDKIIGLEKQRETARKLRQDIKPRTGQMVGNTYVPPAMTQHLADLLNQGVDAYGDYSKAQKIKGLKDEQQRAFANALKGYQDPTSQMDMEQYDPYATPTYLEQNDPYGISTNDPQALSNALMAQENAKQKGIEQQKMSSLNQMYDVDPVKAQRMQADARWDATQAWKEKEAKKNQSRWEQTRQDKLALEKMKLETAEKNRQRNLQAQEDMRVRVEERKQGLKRNEDGGLEYIKGSLGEQKFKKQIAGDYETVLNVINDADKVKQNAFKLIGGGIDPNTGKPYPEHEGLEWATGTSRYAEKVLPSWTETAKARRRIDEIKEQMQAVGKNMMPGLGSMAVQEWSKVEALISQIDASADTDIVREKIQNAVNAFDNLVNIAKNKYQSQYGEKLNRYPEFKIGGQESETQGDSRQKKLEDIRNKYRGQN